jgi:hypothetical protein
MQLRPHDEDEARRHARRVEILSGPARVVTHACPDCDLGRPRPLCPTCLGAGNVSEPRLAKWQRDVFTGEHVPPQLQEADGSGPR